MIILLPTVKHTGSYFCLKRLLGKFNPVELKTARKDIKRLSGDLVVFDHLYRHKMKYWRPLLKKHNAIVPLRNKKLVMESWMNRGEDLEDFHEQWQMMKDIRGKRVFFINIDDPYMRERQLDTINFELGLKLDPGDWEVVRK